MPCPLGHNHLMKEVTTILVIIVGHLVVSLSSMDFLNVWLEQSWFQLEKMNKVAKFYLCFHFSAGEYRSYTVPSFAATSLPTPWMNKNLVKHKKFLEKNYITTLCPFDQPTKRLKIQTRKWCSVWPSTKHTRRFLGLPCSRSKEALIWLTHIWHVWRSLWPNVYAARTQIEGVFDLWKPCTVKR